MLDSLLLRVLEHLASRGKHPWLSLLYHRMGERTAGGSGGKMLSVGAFAGQMVSSSVWERNKALGSLQCS